ncbi:MAG: hypothetical protein D6677_02365 [Calditrichaeota bacterium]|nr:MAG: hypothetical protein D6677_02365 [Calditrichota bacterium]
MAASAARSSPNSPGGGGCFLKKVKTMFKRFLIIVTGCVLAACSNGAKTIPPEKIPQRIVTLAPSITEIAFALGLGKRIVGVSDYAEFPPEVRQKQRVGGLVNPNLEVIGALKPDIILATRSFRRENGAFEQLNWPVHYLPERSLSDLFAAIDSVGRLCAVPGSADSLSGLIRNSLEHYRFRGRDSLNVLLVLGRAQGAPAQIGISGPGAFINDLLEQCGGRNAFDDIPVTYSRISREDLLKRDPQVIIEFTADSSRQTKERLLGEWRLEPRLQAVRHHTAFIVEGGQYLIPGPRVAVLARRFSNLLREARAAYRN